MLATVSALAVMLAAAPAGAAPAAEPPICTTITKVVKRGETVLSTESETKCEGEGGFSLDLGELNPGGVVGSIFNSKPNLEAKEVRGDWRVVERGSRRVCKMTLMAAAGEQGRKVRTVDCIGPQGKAVAWKLEDQSVGLYGADGALIVRLTGDETRLAGSAGGQEVVLQR